MRRWIIATAVAALATAGAQAEQLLGTWAHENEAWVVEYAIESVGADRGIEGTLCAARKGGHIWGIRLEGSALASADGRMMKVSHPAARDQVQLMEDDTLRVTTLDRAGNRKPWTRTFERVARTRCAHRFIPAEPEPAVPENPSEPLVGTWTDPYPGTSFTELVVEKIEGGHAQGRMCMKKHGGDIYLFDFHRKGPNRARYTAGTQTLQIHDESHGKAWERTVEFTTLGRGKIAGSMTPKDPKKKKHVRTFVRGRNAEGCLARTSARIASLAGTWRTKGGAGPATTIRITSDHGDDRVEGFFCTKYEDGRVEAARFGGDAAGRVRSHATTLDITVPGHTRETTHALTSDPTRPGTLLYGYARDGDAEGEGGGPPTTLRRTTRKTCADALRTPAETLPATSAGEAPKGPSGEWTATDAQSGAIFEARIESLRRGRSAVGLVCEATADGSIRWWNLNHPKVRARYDGKSTVQWSRKTGSDGTERETAHRLVLTEAQGREYLSHIAQASGEPTRTTVMRRGRAEGGCLTQIAPQRGARHGADRQRSGQQVGNGR